MRHGSERVRRCSLWECSRLREGGAKILLTPTAQREMLCPVQNPSWAQMPKGEERIKFSWGCLCPQKHLSSTARGMKYVWE